MGKFVVITAAILTMSIAATLTTSAVALAGISDEGMVGLEMIVASFDDPFMNSRDLAFYLTTHNYDATPIEDHVELVIDEATYKLVPNGKDPGLCDIIALNE